MRRIITHKIATGLEGNSSSYELVRYARHALHHLALGDRAGPSGIELQFDFEICFFVDSGERFERVPNGYFRKNGKGADDGEEEILAMDREGAWPENEVRAQASMGSRRRTLRVRKSKAGVFKGRILESSFGKIT